MGIIFVVAAIVAFILLSVYTRALQKLLGTTYRLPALEKVDPGTVPEAIRLFLRAIAPKLAGLGFRPVCFARQAFMETHESALGWLLCMELDGEQTQVRIAPAIAPSRYDPVAVEFATRYEDGTQIVSQNGIGVLDPLQSSQFAWYDPNVDRVSDLWDAHLARLLEHESTNAGSRRVLGQHEESIAAYNQCWAKDITDAGEAGRVKVVDNGFRPKLRSAWSMIQQVKRRQKQRKQVRQRRRGQASHDPDAFATIGESLDLTAVQTQSITRELDDRHAAPARGWHSWGFFLLSMALFGIFFGIWLGWELVPVLIGVLLLHEMGHYAAMRWVGYKALNVFFIPGLGAAVTGYADGVGAWKRIFVLLAGPLPGIAIALLMMFLLPGERPSWVEATILLMIVVNWFNLLPFTPLDGGQVIDTLLGIKGQAVFKWVSAAGLIALAWVMGEPVLWVLGIFGVTTALAFKLTAQLKRSLAGEEMRSLGRGEYTESAVRALQAPQYDNLDLLERANTVDLVLQDRSIRHPGVAGLCGGLLLYLVAFLAPIWMFLVGLSAGGLSGEAVAEPDWQAQMQAAASPEEKFNTAMQAFDYQLDYYAPEQARAHLDQAWSLQPDPTATNDARLLLAEMRLELIQLEDGKPTPSLLQHFERYRDLQVPPDDAYVQVLTQLLYYLPKDGDLRARDLVQDLASYIDGGGAAPAASAGLFLAAAQREQQFDNTEQARKYLEYGIGLGGTHAEALKTALANALLDQEKYQEAIAILEQQLQATPPSAHRLEQLAWANLLGGKGSAATALFEQANELAEEERDVPILLAWLTDFNYSNYAKSNGLINLLVCQDFLGQTGQVAAIVAELKEADEGNEPSYVQQQQEALRDGLEYQRGFQLTVNRMKSKALDRYFPRATTR